MHHLPAHPDYPHPQEQQTQRDDAGSHNFIERDDNETQNTQDTGDQSQPTDPGRVHSVVMGAVALENQMTRGTSKTG